MTTDKSPIGAQDDALRLAAEFEDCGDSAIPSINDIGKAADELRRLHARVQELERAVADEREACAPACEKQAQRCVRDRARYFASGCAAVIRASGAQGESE